MTLAITNANAAISNDAGSRCSQAVKYYRTLIALDRVKTDTAIVIP